MTPLERPGPARSPLTIRPLTTHADFRRVLALEQEVWGYTDAEEAVPVPLMEVNAKTGGVMLGAFEDDGRMVGFVYAIPAFVNGRVFQWSHMTGVSAACRGRGVGWALKREQRRVTLEMGIDLIEWTFDPLQAVNAHFNLARLGTRAREYHRDVYGESPSVLHAGTATDRFIAEWWLNEPRVVSRMDAAPAGAGAEPPAAPGGDVVAVNRVTRGVRWPAPGEFDLTLDAPLLGVTIPAGFTEMQLQDPALAREWRAATRAIFEGCLARGYEVTDFVLERGAETGTYLLARG